MLDYISNNKELILICTSGFGLVCVITLVGCTVYLRNQEKKGIDPTKLASSPIGKSIIDDLLQNPHANLSQGQAIINYLVLGAFIFICLFVIGFSILKY